MNTTPSRLRFAAVSTAVVAAAVGVATTAAASGTSPVYTHKDSGRTVHLAVGSVFRVSLRTCTDCGDSWHWVHRPDPHIVKLVRKRVVSNVQPPAVGGIAHTIYRFKVVAVGRTREVLVEKGPSGTAISHFRLREVAHQPR